MLNYVNAATFIFDLFSLLDSTLGHICGFVFLFFIRGFMVIDEKVGKATSIEPRILASGEEQQLDKSMLRCLRM